MQTNVRPHSPSAPQPNFRKPQIKEVGPVKEVGAVNPLESFSLDGSMPPASFEMLQRFAASSEYTSGMFENSVQRADPSAGIGDVLVNEIKNVNNLQSEADENVHTLLTGGDINQAEVLTSIQKADLSFRMLMQIRNKLLDAFNQIQQIQI